MITTSQPFDLEEVVQRVVPNVLETMLAMKVEVEGAGNALGGECVSGAIGIEGEGLSGVVYVHLTEALANRGTVAMLGLAEGEVPDNGMVNDVTRELANMIGGGLKSALCDAGRACAMSTPSIVRGPAFAVELPPDMQARTFVFASRGERLAIEIHLKLTD